MKHALLNVFVLGLIVVSPLYSQKNGDYSSEALRGLSSLGVRVEFDGNADHNAGLSAEQLRSEVLIRLAVGGLKVLDGRGQQKAPYLYLSVHSVPVTEHAGSPESYCYAASLDLIEEVRLAHNPGISTDACLWSEGYSIIVPRNDLRQVTEKVGDLAAEFVKAVQTSNQIQEPEVRAMP